MLKTFEVFLPSPTWTFPSAMLRSGEVSVLGKRTEFSLCNAVVLISCKSTVKQKRMNMGVRASRLRSSLSCAESIALPRKYCLEHWIYV